MTAVGSVYVVNVYILKQNLKLFNTNAEETHQ